MKMSHFSIAAILFVFSLSACAQDNEPILRTVAVDGGEMEYAEYGNSQGEPVILVHGGFVADAFLPLALADELSDFRLILVHLRGYAGSSRVEIPFGSADDASDIVTLMEMLDISNAHWVGHSSGGVVALRAAVEHPERLKTISLIEPGGAPSNLIRQFAPSRPTPDSNNQLAANAFTPEQIHAFNERRIDRLFGGRENLDAIPGAYEQFWADLPTVFEVRRMTPPWQFEPETHLPVVQQPIIFIYFEGGNPWLPTFSEMFQQYHAATEVVPLEGAHHSFHVEQPQETAEVIASFLKRNAMESSESHAID